MAPQSAWSVCNAFYFHQNLFFLAPTFVTSGCKWNGAITLERIFHLPKREADPFQNGWIFGKVPRGGGGSFSIQKFMLQIFAIIDDTSVMNFRKNLQHNFPKMRGGGQRPFGTFPKIHPFWKGKASLREIDREEVGDVRTQRWSNDEGLPSW